MDIDVSKNKMVIMDVDGTLTDGKINVTTTGEHFKSFSTRDGLGIILLHKFNIIPVIITGAQSLAVTKRADMLNIKEVHQGVKDKTLVYTKIKEKYNLKDEEIAYIGDDLNDYTVMVQVGLRCCVADGVPEIKKIANFITEQNGGNGAVRDLVNFILKDKLDGLILQDIDPNNKY